MLLRKQTSYHDGFSVAMRFRPSRPGYEAGLVLWWSQFAYATVGVAAVELPDGAGVAERVVLRRPTGRAGDMQVRLSLSPFLLFFSFRLLSICICVHLPVLFSLSLSLFIPLRR